MYFFLFNLYFTRKNDLRLKTYISKESWQRGSINYYYIILNYYL